MVVSGLNKNIVVNGLKDRINLLIDTMRSAILTVVNENSDDFNAVAQEIQDNIVTVIVNNTVGDSLIQLFDAYDLVGDTARNRYLLAKEIFEFGDNETNINANVDLTIALTTINTGAQLMTLSLAYDNAVNIDFDNEDDLASVMTDLQNEYDRLVEDNSLDSDSRLALVDLKTSSVGFFSDLDLKAVTNATVSTKTPSTVLSYLYYKDSSLSDQIVSLNKAYNTGFIEGDIQILSEN